jgi:hypothetical protein
MREVSNITTRGDVEIITEWRDGKKQMQDVRNTILLTGRRALCKSLANQIGDSYQFYITRMLFGDGGTQDGVKKYVNAGRDGLFGVTRLSKPVIAGIDGSIPTQVILTSVIGFDEIIGVTLSEMALQMATGDLYSMTTFADLNKTEDMQITFNWRLNFI